jgi:hypothetical protein
MNTHCDHCGKETNGKRFCCERCKWTWHNHNRTLTPNMIYDCEVCAKHVEKWCSPATIKAGINQGRFCSRTCAGKWRRGENHPNWLGGRQKDKDGYVLVYRPQHPHANKNGYVRLHRLVMESHIGRFLRPEEVVHHRNDNPKDNSYRNLKLYPNNSAHKADDAKRRNRDAKGRLLPCS